jgi:hypothetical protein
MTFIKTESLTARKLLLLDGLGDVTSAIFLGVVLVEYQKFIGLPVNLLYFLALIAVFFAVYSLSCHFLLKQAHVGFLKIIAMANSAYCALTLLLVILFLEHIKPWGLAYFAGEIILVVGLVILEFSVVFREERKIKL